MRTLRLRIPIRRSRNPQRPHAYAVHHGAAWLLKAGWTMVHDGNKEAYLEPPSLPARSEVEVTIPNESEIAGQGPCISRRVAWQRRGVAGIV
jgi:hypothetical protein